MSLKGSTIGTLLSLACLAAAAAGFHGSAARAAQPPPAPASAAAKPGVKPHKAVRRMPRLNERIAGYPKWKRTMIMAGGATTRKSYEVSYGGVNYTVGTERESDVIKWIGTTDPAFRTPEGLAVGDTLEKVLAVAKQEVGAEPGWAFHVMLPSGWNAAFVQGPSMTEGVLPPTAGVSFFFKRDNWAGPRAAPTPIP